MYIRWRFRAVMDTPSGLFVRRRFDCGMKLQLQPFHSLVMTAYHLAKDGCQDDDLFGMLACVLCLISCGFDPRKAANVSVTALMQTDAADMMCTHEELTAAQLAERISTYSSVNSFSAKISVGWAVLSGVLRLCEDALADPDRDELDSNMEDDEDYSSYFIGTTEPDVDIEGLHFENHNGARPFCSRRDLATLWASVQAELLSYRRLDHGMDWISRNFSMEELRDQIARGEPLSVKYAQQDLLKPHCICGSFGAFPLPVLSDATNPNIANLDIWDRATYKAFPENDDY